MTGASCIYSGWVMHRRLRPVRHQFRYRSWWLLLDLEEIDALDLRLTAFSRNRRNLISFHDSDHGHDDGVALRDQIARRLSVDGIDYDGGPIRLLCTPRVLGYQFNPLSVYFCHRRDGSLAAIVYEVHNTYGERHSYCLRSSAHDERTVHQRCAKQFYVSPFLGMGMSYGFRVAPPHDTLTIGITGSDKDHPLIHAVLTADRHELSDRRLLALLCSQPFVSLKVTAAIHFEALRLWRKGLAIHPHIAVRTEPQNDSNTSERQHA